MYNLIEKENIQKFTKSKIRRIKVNIKSITKEKLAETWGSMQKDKVGLYKTDSFCSTRVENVIMSDSY